MEREELKPKPSLLERWKESWYDQYRIPKTFREELKQLFNAWHDYLIGAGVYNRMKNNNNQTGGFVQFPLLLVLAVAVLVGAYYVGTSAGKLPQINISLTPPLPPEVPNQTSPSKNYDDLIAKAKSKGSVRVIVELKGQWQLDSKLAAQEAQAQQTRIAQVQDNLLIAMSSYTVTSITKFTYIPGMAFDVDLAGLMYLISNPEINNIKEDIPLPPSR